ncbi:hypothetical protein N9L68_09085 [bacterium]|nr:hypothetical protein [bacterium]
MKALRARTQMAIPPCSPATNATGFLTFHSKPQQMQLQFRESWGSLPEPKVNCRSRIKGGVEIAAQSSRGKGQYKSGDCFQRARGKGKELGPNMNAVTNGNHSRWSRHLQRGYGVIYLALPIAFTGRLDVGKLREAPDAQSGASQLGDARLKRTAKLATQSHNTGKRLHNKVGSGRSIWDFAEHDRKLLRDIRSGELLR